MLLKTIKNILKKPYLKIVVYYKYITIIWLVAGFFILSI